MFLAAQIILKCVVFTGLLLLKSVNNTLNAFVKNEDYHVKKAYVLSNTREITTNGKITYIPIYDVMFLGDHITELL